MSIGKIRTGRKAGAIHREKIGEMQGRRQLNVMSKCEADPPIGKKKEPMRGDGEGGAVNYPQCPSPDGETNGRR